jgi:hypothetical protein
MMRVSMVAFLGLTLLASPLAADAQPPAGKVWRIGVLSGGT